MTISLIVSSEKILESSFFSLFSTSLLVLGNILLSFPLLLTCLARLYFLNLFVPHEIDLINLLPMFDIVLVTLFPILEVTFKAFCLIPPLFLPYK